jgi:hypothetical protein
MILYVSIFSPHWGVSGQKKKHFWLSSLPKPQTAKGPKGKTFCG